MLMQVNMSIFANNRSKFVVNIEFKGCGGVGRGKVVKGAQFSLKSNRKTVRISSFWLS